MDKGYGGDGDWVKLAGEKMIKESIRLLSFALILVYATTAFAQSRDNPQSQQQKDPCASFEVSPAPGSTIILDVGEPLSIWAEFLWANFPSLTYADVWVEGPAGTIDYCDDGYSAYQVTTQYECLVAPWDAPTGGYTLFVQFSPWKTCEFDFRVKRRFRAVDPVETHELGT